MATVAELAVEPDDFPLGRVFESLAGVHVELERVVTTDDAVIRYLWVRGAAAEAIEALPGVHPDVGAITVVDTAGEAVLVRLDWNREIEGVVGHRRDRRHAAGGARYRRDVDAQGPW